jgi:hypothetical protein
MADWTVPISSEDATAQDLPPAARSSSGAIVLANEEVQS